MACVPARRPPPPLVVAAFASLKIPEQVTCLAGGQNIALPFVQFDRVHDRSHRILATAGQAKDLCDVQHRVGLGSEEVARRGKGSRFPHEGFARRELASLSQDLRALRAPVALVPDVVRAKALRDLLQVLLRIFEESPRVAQLCQPQGDCAVVPGSTHRAEGVVADAQNLLCLGPIVDEHEGAGAVEHDLADDLAVVVHRPASFGEQFSGRLDVPLGGFEPRDGDGNPCLELRLTGDVAKESPTAIASLSSWTRPEQECDEKPLDDLDLFETVACSTSVLEGSLRRFRTRLGSAGKVVALRSESPCAG